MAKLVLAGYILVPDRDLSAALRELPSHIALTLQEPGCISFSVAQSASNPNRFDVNESFISETAFEQHQARARSATWGQVSKNAERHYQVKLQ